MFCRFFILRPVLSMVISIIITIAGLVAMAVSPIEQYPNIVPPCLNISVPFPGANSETIANAVAAPIEDQMSGVAGMIYMQSSSQNGNNTLMLNVYFQTGTNLQFVEADALNRIQTAMPQLPTQVQQQGITMRMQNPDLFIVTPFYSETGTPDRLFIANYMQRYIYPLVEQIPGVGVAAIQGQRAYAIRIATDPNKLKYYGLDVHDIEKVVNDQNWPYAIGLNAMAPMAGPEKFNYLINSPGYMTNESQFQNLVIKASEKNAQVVRLKDVAHVSLDAEAYQTYFDIILRDPDTGKPKVYPAVGLKLYLVPGANQIQVRDEYNKLLSKMSSHMPTGIKYFNFYDSSEFVELSVQSVVSTLIIAFILVFFVVMLFIQNIKGTIIPVIAIPVAIIGTFAGTFALGFSINTLTLFGMVLAIGIVVDDAIVVLENVERLMADEGLNSVQASIKGMEQVAAPVIAVVCVLNAVFVPVAFLGGFSGVLMQQFAVTIAISVLLSGVVALTLTPTLCAIFLKNVHHGEEKPEPKFILLKWLNKFFDLFNKGFAKVQNAYMFVVTKIVDNTKKGLLIWCGVLIAVAVMFMKIPTGLIPLEDMGYFYNVDHVASGGSINYSVSETTKTAESIMEQIPYVKQVAILGGADIVDNGTVKTSVSTMSIILNDYDKRSESQDVNAAIKHVNEITRKNNNLRGLAFNQPPIRGMSPTGGVTFYLQAALPSINTPEQIKADSVKLVNYLQKNYPDVVGNAFQLYDVDTPEIDVNVDARKAYIYDVPFANIFNTLQSVFGTYYVNYFTMWNDLYWVIVQSDYQYRNRPELMNVVYAKSNKGDMVPLGSLVSFKYRNGAEVVTRMNDYLASQIVVNPNPITHASSGEVMTVIKEAVPKVLGPDYVIDWFGPSYQQNLAGNQSVIAFSLGLIMVFLILAALYEMWVLPIAIMMGLPFALFGAGLTLILFRMENDIYFQVSLLTLIGLSAKNAILIVEFAIESVRAENMSYREAAIHAARVRFRPIIMTSIAFILGAVPLATATGAGANSQHSVGFGIIGGMIGSTCIATLFIPAFFVICMNMSKKEENNS
jgi:hydrophobe/amphiphile efflux-1 (HAE1) family protein